MILVAQLEAVNTQERPVTRFIVDDLTQRLQIQIPYSNLVIREYPAVIHSEQEAQEAAATSGAAVVVWGNYTAEFVELNAQIGDTSDFPHIQIARDVLERTANVRVRLTNEREQTVARQALGVLNVLYTAEGDTFEILRTFTILSEIDAPDAEIVSSGVAGHVYRGVSAFINDTPLALQEVNAAIELDGGNPILYIYRTGTRQRLGLFDDSLQDAETAARLGPPNWVTPLIMKANRGLFLGNFDEAIAYYDQVIAQHPDDWSALNQRGAMLLLKGDFKAAKADLDHAVALDPPVNLPYVWSAMLALHEGRMDDAKRNLVTVLLKFPDPTFGERIVRAFVGEVPNIFTPALSAFGKLTLGQYNDAIQAAEAGLKINPQFTDLHMMEGLAYCNLDKLDEAEAAYTKAIEIEPDFVLLYLLRADVRLRHNNAQGAAEDIAFIQQSPQAQALAPYVAAAQTGKLTCRNMFTFQP